MVGNLTQCALPDGRHCAVASTGKKFCFAPNETGTKVSGNEAVTKAPVGVAVKEPPVPPKNNGDWQASGTGTASVSGNGTTNNYNISTFNSNYGTEGKGGGAEGDGPGEGEGDGEGGTAGPGVGTLYERTDKTIGSLLTNFYNEVTSQPIFEALTAFMHAEGGGSCPVFSLEATDYWRAMTYDAHCSGDFLAVLQAMGWVLMALAAYAAARIAFS